VDPRVFQIVYYVHFSHFYATFLKSIVILYDLLILIPSDRIRDLSHRGSWIQCIVNDLTFKKKIFKMMKFEIKDMGQRDVANFEAFFN